jgi:L-alanine-DL-glutamate epimerase-like enolase superfamily enzyme
MRVTHVRPTVLSIPNREPSYWSGGCTRGINSILVEVETDEGITGTGEASGDRSVEVSLGVIRSAARVLEGEDPFEVERFLARFYRIGKWTEVRRLANQALAGVEMALWDIIGQVCDQPLHRLLGGAVRERISFFGFLQGDDPDALAEAARHWSGRGFDVLYMKVGRGRERDVACLRAVRDAAGPRARLRVDANQAWTVGEAVRELNALAEFDLDLAEQPIHWADLDGLARVRAAVPMPVAVDQGCFTEFDALEVIRKGAADVLVVGFHETGGLLGLRKVAAVAAAGGLPLCRHGVSGETGVSTLAALQVLATIPNQTDGHQVMHQLLREDILEDGVLAFDDGHIAVPTRPGLGVRLDRDRVARYARLFAEQGPFYNEPA